MGSVSSTILCDGCGLPASPGHIAARLERLELATQFRPIHIHVLFVTLQPMPRPEDDFYRPPESRDFFNSFLTALDISADPAGLLEFQRRGYYLTYESECPLTPPSPEDANTGGDAALKSIARLAPTLVNRIRFNYKPRYVSLLGTNATPLVGVLRQAGLAPLLLLDNARPLTLPEPGDTASLARFREVLAVGTPQAKSSSGV